VRNRERSGSRNEVLGIGILCQIADHELRCTDGIPARVCSRPTAGNAVRWSGGTGISTGT
jgi:hypothetical protein